MTAENTTAAEAFDLTEWLANTDQDDITDRSHKSVTVYRHPAQLDAAIERVKVLEAAYNAELQAHQQRPAEDLALNETATPAPDSSELDAARAELSQLAERNALTVTCYALTATEARDAVKGTEPGTPARMYALVQASVRLPGNQRATVEQWEQLHHAIGQAQMNRLETTIEDTFKRDTGAEVTALFSRRS